MLHLSYCVIAAGLGLTAGAPKITVHDHHQGPQCRNEYITVWETEYEERETHECVTKWVPECKTEYETFIETECSNCDYETFIKTECSNCEYRWEAEGNNMEWVVIKKSPVRVSRKVPKTVCDDGYATHANEVAEVVKARQKDRKHHKDHKSGTKNYSEENASEEDKKH